MKYIGMIILTVCTTLIGLSISEEAKKKVTICYSLNTFCDLLLADFNTKKTPVVELVTNILEMEQFKNIGFISSDMILNMRCVDSILNEEENIKLSVLLNSLGKSDINSQINLVTDFKRYINNCEKNYKELYIRQRKIYLALGFFSGFVISILLV